MVRLNGQPRSVQDLEVLFPRNSKRHWASRALEYSGCGPALRFWPAWRGVLVLNYHRIGDPVGSDFDRDLWSATPEWFDEQMAFLKRYFHVIGLSDLDRALEDRAGQAVMITFDDGYLDNYACAFPILKKYGLPATFFVTTGFLDQGLVPWWDEIAWMVRRSEVDRLPESPWTKVPIRTDGDHCELAITRLLKIYKQLKSEQTGSYLDFLAETLQTGRCPSEIAKNLWMTWDMVREMRSNGMTIGGHSVTHPILANQTAEQQDYEVRESRRRLVEELGEPIDAFSYPVGGGSSFDEITQAAIHRHGYRWGFTYLGGYLKPGRFDRFALRRAAVEMDTDLPLFRAMASLPQYFA